MGPSAVVRPFFAIRESRIANRGLHIVAPNTSAVKAGRVRMSNLQCRRPKSGKSNV